ncbi:MAG: ABC transporter permease subunit [Defluviitaleaceae bacterium]|nr:ABC transporter permease subunit [Defluviitaleaceae bacterium]
MTAFCASYRNELIKLLRRKKYIVFLAIGVLICIIWAALGGAMSGFIGRMGHLTINLTPTPMGALSFFLQLLIPLLIFMGATDLITVEGAEGTMKGMICRPAERWKLYTGKLLAIMTYVAIYLACVFVVSAILSQVFGRPLGAGELFAAFAAYMLTIPPLAVLAAFAALVALMGRSGTLTMLLLIAAYLAMSVLPIIFPVLAQLLFTSYLGWHRLWIGALPQGARLVHIITILLGYGTVFFVAGSLIFERKEY